MDSFWGVSPWRWPGPSQPIRGWRLNQLWSIPEAPQLWEHQDRAYHRHVLSKISHSEGPLKWQMGLLYSESQVGWGSCHWLGHKSKVVSTAAVWTKRMTQLYFALLECVCYSSQMLHFGFQSSFVCFASADMMITQRDNDNDFFYLHLPSGQTPQSPSSSHQHHLTSPTMKASTSYFSSWCSVPERLWNQGHTWA